MQKKLKLISSITLLTILFISYILPFVSRASLIDNFVIKSNNYKIKKSEKAHAIFTSGLLGKAGLSEDIFNLAFAGFTKLKEKELLSRDSIMTIIDFSKPSNEKRLFVIDLKSGKLLYNSVVAHGRNTGEKYATTFSNKLNSHMSSLGFYITRKTYMGGNGYSLQLDGIEKGYNDKAMERSIVVHGADYADDSILTGRGYLGRSYGCPALPRKISKLVIDKIKGGTMVFAYYPDEKYLKHSSILN